MRQKPASYEIRYEFHMEGGEVHAHHVTLDSGTLQNRNPLPADPPSWTRLDFHKCPNCPLRAEETPHCPTAAHLSELIESFGKTMSYATAMVHVDTPERQVRKQTSVQAGLASLLGIHMTTSGCPVLARLRPLVRFHLPFANEEETIFRAVSMYLVTQYVRRQKGLEPDWELDGLVAIYREVGLVNRAFADRLRGAVEKDASLNALVRLDCLGKSLPVSIADQLEEISYLFGNEFGP